MARRFNHLSPRYIKDRLCVWYYEMRHPEVPWLTSDAVRLLNELLKKDDVGVEFGSGRSTLWFAKHLGHLTSIESDGMWFEKVSSLIQSADLSSVVDYRKCENEAEYARQATLFSNNSIDFCLVDGMVRDQCALSILPKIKSSGILVIDNINWFLPNDLTHSPDSKRSQDGAASDIWALFSKEVSTWRHIWTSNGVTDTCIWFKP